MSFNQAADDLERGDAFSVHYKDYPDFETYSQAIESGLYTINNKHLVSVRNLIAKYESLARLQDVVLASRIAHRIVELTTKTTEQFKNVDRSTRELNEYLRRCELNHEDEDLITYLRQKEAVFINLIKSSLQNFQRSQKKFESLQKTLVKQTANTAATEGNGVASNPQQSAAQQQVQIEYEPVNAEELEEQTLLIEEREHEIRQISQDTQEINEIFLNLQDIIQEQQFQIDLIEDNILSYSTDAREASTQLRKAERYQRRAGGRMVCCFLILLGVLGSVIFIGVVF